MSNGQTISVKEVCDTLESHLGEAVLCRYLDNNPGDKPYCDFVESPILKVNRSTLVSVEFEGIGIPLGEQYHPEFSNKSAIADIVAKDGNVIYRNREILTEWLGCVPPDSPGLVKVREKYSLRV